MWIEQVICGKLTMNQLPPTHAVGRQYLLDTAQGTDDTFMASLCSSA